MTKLRAGDWVEIRSKEEILRSLDKRGQLDGLPFMPEMFQYCGQRFQVFKRAHKTCDTVNCSGGRWLNDGIHLNLRCDGKAHGNCQAACLIFWKDDWLKPIDNIAERTTALSGDKSAPHSTSSSDLGCSEEDVWRATRSRDQDGSDKPRYACQATQLPYFTSPLPWWDIRQYVEDYSSRNTAMSRILCGFAYLAYYHGTQAWRDRVGRPSRWLYDRFQSLWGGIPFPRTRGVIADGQPTPACTLDLKPGELVRVKSHKEILATIDGQYLNRGLAFDAELVPFCGGVYRVQARVENFIDERTGRMRSLKTPAVILEGVCCQSRYSNKRMFCPRSIYSWWREIWLERVSGNSDR